MKKRMNRFAKRLLATWLCLVMLVGMLPVVTSSKDTPTRVADPSTMDKWEDFFGSENGLTTKHSGGIWTDKSVFLDATDFASYGISMNDPDNFLVALSAIASNTVIKGHSVVPTDTIIILDFSNSMVDQDGNNDVDYMTPMVKAANDSIAKLNSIGTNNRVGVVVYDSDSTVILPLDRYTAGTNGTYLTLARNNNNSGNNRGTLSVTAGVTKAGRSYSNSVQVGGGTYTQLGLYRAWEQFRASDITVATGAARVPVVVLMSDGMPTYGDTDFTNVGNNNIGDGTSTSDEVDECAFVTQLTAAWLRGKLQEKYGEEPIFYTLGLGVSNNSLATSVLDPGTTGGSTATRWSEYMALLQAGDSAASMTLVVEEPVYRGSNPENLSRIEFPEYSDRNGGWTGTEADFRAWLNATFPNYDPDAVVDYDAIETPEQWRAGLWGWGSADNNFEGWLEDTFSLRASGGESYELSYQSVIDGPSYVDQYFAAADADELITGFESIVSDVETKSAYSPTLTGENRDFDGYITFHDKLGSFMEVKAVKGLLLGDTYFSGARVEGWFHEDSPLGTADNPTELGNAFIAAVMNRMDIGLQEADDLVEAAYLAGQLSSTSNYIGWYSDADGKYLGFWNDRDPGQTPQGDAVYANRCYGYIGEVTNDNNETNLLYVIVQVHIDLATGEQEVVFRIPSSLIPVVTYTIDIQGASLNDIESATMTQDPASPLRLVYEVGLRSDIDAYNVIETVGTDYAYIEDGVYKFYTNLWNTADPSTFTLNHHINATSWFEPSLENDRFYYTTDTPLYKKVSGNYVLTTPSDSPATDGGTYYRKRLTFTTSADSSEATIHTEYVEILAIPQAAATYSEADGYWYVPKNLPHYPQDLDTLNKLQNLTGTRDESLYVNISSLLVPSSQNYVSYVHGNNAYMTMTPAQGIRLTKTAEGLAAGSEEIFIFDIALTMPAGAVMASSYPSRLVKADGTVINSTATVEDGKVSVALQHGDVFYLTGLPTGTVYVVTEQDHEDYRLEEINGEKATSIRGTVSEYTITDIHAYNALRQYGQLSISKTVTHNLGDGFTLNANQSFPIRVTFPKATAPTALYVNGNTAPTALTVPADGDPYIEVSIKAGETVILSGFELATTYTVTEQAPAGYTMTGTGLTGSINKEMNSAAALVNTYDPADATGENITVSGTKTLDGRQWLATDAFTFSLYRVDGSQRTLLGSDSVNSNKKDYDLSAYMSREVFETLGEYRYVVVEEATAIGGVTPGATERGFTVTVTDTDADGYLEYTVTATAPATAAKTGHIWAVDADFTNRYAAAGEASVQINIQKEIHSTSGATISLAGFLFGLYSEDEELISTATTNANGVASFTVRYDPQDLNKQYTYFVHEIEPESKIPGMVYNTEETHSFWVEVYDNLDGTIGARFVDMREGTSLGTTAQCTVTNDYVLTDATLPVTVTKVLSGRDAEDAEFTFRLYITGSDFDTKGLTPETATNVGTAVSFINRLYTRVDTYYYVIDEVIPADTKGITYDTARYQITVAVTDGGEGALVANIVNITKLLNGTETDVTGSAIQFNNRYAPVSGSAVTVNVQKAIRNETGVAQPLSGYRFVLTDAKGQEIAAKVTGNNGLVSFTITVPADTKPDTYLYYVKEVKPDSNAIVGMTYVEAPIALKVKVTDNGDGTLTAVLVDDNGATKGQSVDLTFTNIFALNSATLTLPVTKTLTGGRPLGNEFTFYLYQTDATFAVEGLTALQIKKNNGTTVPFEEITYDKAGTYYYVVYEDAAQPILGVAYDPAHYQVTVEVTDGGEGSLVAEITKITKVVDTVATEASAIAFVNAYAPVAGDTVTVTVTKDFENETGVTLSPENYEFGLYDAEGNLLVSAKTNASGVAVLTYTTPVGFVGNVTYTVKEIVPSEKIPGMSYNETGYPFAVTVEDNFDGYVTATFANGTDAAVQTVTNTFALTETEVRFEATKELTGDKALNDNDYTFLLYEMDGETFTTEGYQPIQTKSNVGGKVTFDSITYTTVGIRRYLIVEEVGSALGVTYDANRYQITVTVTDGKDGTLHKAVSIVKVTPDGETTVEAIDFVNRYAPVQGDELTLNIQKEIANHTGVSVALSGFAFVIRDDTNTELATVETGANGAASYTIKVPADKIGTFTYTVTEVELAEADRIPGMTYNTQPVEVKIQVVDNKDGTVTATFIKEGSEGVKSETVKVVNTYTLTDATLTLEGDKTLNGRPLKDGEFTFDLYASENGTDFGGDPLQRKTNVGTLISFDELSFSQAATYYYFLVENSTAQTEGVLYDPTVYRVTLTVDSDGKGGLAVTEELYEEKTENGYVEAESLSFVNHFTSASVDVIFTVNKVMTDTTGTYTAEGFTFAMAGTGIEGILTARSNENGVATFARTYSHDHIGQTFTYTVTETAGDITGMTYDDTVYTVTVKVTQNDDGILQLAYQVAVDDEEAETVSAVEMTFRNEYKKVVPPLGSDLLLWLALALVSGGITFVTAVKKRRILAE